MSDDLDLRAIHRRHEPDPRFVVALGDRLEAILANSASADLSTDGGSARTIELERLTPDRRVGSIIRRASSAVGLVVAFVYRTPKAAW